MNRVKRISFLVTAACMAFCLLLSATDLIIKEEVAGVKKISVYVASEETPYLVNLKRGILDTANESRVDVNYVTYPGGEEAHTFSQLQEEYEGGSQAVILFAEYPKEVRKLARRNLQRGLMVTANAFGSSVKGVPDTSFDVTGAAEELSDVIQKEYGTEAKIILLTGTEGISEEIGTILKKEFEEKGMETASQEGTAEKPGQHGKERENMVYVGCWIKETEQAAESLNGEALYGIGYSDRVLNGIKEGKIAGVEAFSMYAMGICAMQQAIAVIENGKAANIQLPCKMITKENIEEEEEFLVPIH